MPREKRQVESSLKAKGFEPKEGDHHYFYYRTVEGKKTTAFTFTSHTRKEKTISDELLSKMAKQCRLTKQDFLKLVDCPLDRDGYETFLAAQGLL